MYGHFQYIVVWYRNETKKKRKPFFCSAGMAQVKIQILHNSHCLSRRRWSIKEEKKKKRRNKKQKSFGLRVPLRSVPCKFLAAPSIHCRFSDFLLFFCPLLFHRRSTTLFYSILISKRKTIFGISFWFRFRLYPAFIRCFTLNSDRICHLLRSLLMAI